jgi:hypothetical protein
MEAFAAIQAALDSEYAGDKAGHLLVRGEFNHTGESIDPLWNTHISKVSLMVGAKNLGSAPLVLGGGTGYEAEIVLPKSKNQRMWTGIFSYGLTILHLMAAHPLEQRDWFEPLATGIVTSLRFLRAVPGLLTTEVGIPLPSGYTAKDPVEILQDIDDPQSWQAWSGGASVNALQAFYVRELPNYDWEIEEFTPYPSQSRIYFARLRVRREGQSLVVGLLPEGKGENESSIVIKLEN